MASADGTTVHTYLYDNSGALIRETRDYPDGTQDIMEFLYDQSGRPYAFVLNNVTYYYVLNLQGDIVRLVNTAGTTVVSYVYNAWGKILSTQTTSLSYSATVAAKNPLRYRGYYYDTETQLYYCQSRYYDPATGRFINADAFASTGQGLLGYNMFTYCLNNPVLFSDHTGTACVLQPLIAGYKEDYVEEYLTPSNSYGAIISGSSVTVSSIIAHTASAVDAASRPSNIGIGTFARLQAEEIAYLRTADSALSKASNVLAYGAVAIDVISGIGSNINNEASLGKIVFDASVDVLVTGGTIWVAGAVGAKIGALAGSAVPGAGNIVGGIAGFVIGASIYVATDMIDYNGKTARGWLKGVVD